MKNHITIFGAGNLTRSILNGIDLSNASHNIDVIDVDKKKRIGLKKYGVSFRTAFTDSISQSDFILLLVKPKEYIKLIKSIDKLLNKKTIIISFMAGISIKQIQDNLSTKVNIIRAMTNLTVSNGKAIIFYYNKISVNKSAMKAESFFKTFSKIKKCKSEDQLDKITALYGSGPAYYVYFNDIITRSFMELGFNRRDSITYADNLISETSNLLKDWPNTKNLIKSIASKGGTTEAALLKLNNEKVRDKVSLAIKSAYDKSKNILKK